MDDIQYERLLTIAESLKKNIIDIDSRIKAFNEKIGDLSTKLIEIQDKINELHENHDENSVNMLNEMKDTELNLTKEKEMLSHEKNALLTAKSKIESQLAVIERDIDSIRNKTINNLLNTFNELIEESETKNISLESLDKYKINECKLEIGLINSQFDNAHTITLPEIYNVAKSELPNLDNELLLLLLGIVFNYDFTYYPDFIKKFIKLYLKDINKKTILDPWFDPCSLVLNLENSFFNKNLQCIIPEDDFGNFMQEIYGDLNIEWHYQTKKDVLDKFKSENKLFDVIIGNPPSTQLKIFNDVYFSKDIHDDLDKILLLKASVLLREDGIGLFFIKNNFLYQVDENNVLNSLNKFGLYIEAILNLPDGIINLDDYLLLIIRRKKFSDVFIGDISLNDDVNKILIENLRLRKKGKTPQRGAIIKNIETFFSFKKYYSELEFRKIAKNTGLEPILLNSIISDVFYFDKDENVDEINSLYIPTESNYPAITTVKNKKFLTHYSEELSKIDSRYMKLILKIDKVNSDYLVHFYNSEFGKKIRNSLEIKNATADINKQIFLNSEVYLPDIKIQKQVLELNSSINDILTQLNIDKRNLWKYPRSTKEIKGRIELLNRGFTLEDWIDTLPFPLASILWSYESEINRHLKFKYLLRFFEAYSEFNLAFMLSAITQDMKFFKEHFGKCMRNAFTNWYIEPDFGNWTHIGKCLAKQIRTILEGPEKQHCLELFGNPDSDLLRITINTELYNLLEEARDKRNRWDAHDTPTIPSEECDKRIEILLDLLAKLRSLTSDFYDAILFFIAIKGGCTRDGCSYEIKELKGPMTSFKKNIVETSENVLLSEIYFINENQLKPINMLPFIKIRESPHQEQDACYFYNRIQEGEARLVTYHFKKKFEDLIPEEEFELLDILKSL